MQSFYPTRRGFIKLGLATVACTVASPALAAIPHFKGIKRLALHNLHTDERLDVTYWQNGEYTPSALSKIDYILRDHYSGDVHTIDHRLLDLVHDLQMEAGNDHPVEIISGYRSPSTNLHLASATSGVAKNSYHTKGMAVDIRLSGTALSSLHNIALNMGRGGVGYYPDSQFVHVDVGPRRWW